MQFDQVWYQRRDHRQQTRKNANGEGGQSPAKNNRDFEANEVSRWSTRQRCQSARCSVLGELNDAIPKHGAD